MHKGPWDPHLEPLAPGSLDPVVSLLPLPGQAPHPLVMPAAPVVSLQTWLAAAEPVKPVEPACLAASLAARFHPAAPRSDHGFDDFDESACMDSSQGPGPPGGMTQVTRFLPSRACRAARFPTSCHLLPRCNAQGDNILVDQSGAWWLGDFGSAVAVGQPIHSTTHWFAPSPRLIGQPAKFCYDW